MRLFIVNFLSRTMARPRETDGEDGERGVLTSDFELEVYPVGYNPSESLVISSFRRTDVRPLSTHVFRATTVSGSDPFRSS